jgi:membrane-bound lytic murein transglycosylase D
MAAGRRVLPRETAAYVPKLMAAAIIAKRPEAFGFSRDEIEPHRWTEYDTVSLNRKTELSFVAQAAQVPVEALLDLNPELRRTCTPPRPYSLKIPRDRAQVFAAAWPRVLEQSARTAVARHQVRRGESLAEIARAYDVPVQHLAGLNHLGSWGYLRPGTVLAVPIGSVPRREAEALARRYRATATTRVRIASGDTLSGIARRHGVSVDALAAWNGIRNPAHHKLYAGRYLVVRKRGAAESIIEVDRSVARADHQPRAKRKSVAEAPRTVRVQSGDSLGSVARRFGVSIVDLARWNSIPKPHRHRLRAGSTLIVRFDGAG